VRVDLLEHDLTLNASADEVIAVDEAIDRLGAQDHAAAEILKLKYYGGLTLDEAAEMIGISRATAYRHWTYARAWVRAEVLSE
jgi:RNA polymerase sigma factor (sigma-70 family)